MRFEYKWGLITNSKMKYIFEEIIKDKTIFVLIEEHFTDVEERDHIKSIVNDTFHHKLVDAVLDELDQAQRLLFLAEVDDEKKHEPLLDKLRYWIEDLEVKLHLRAKEAEDEMLKLIDVA
jgi:hypothetical protein